MTPDVVMRPREVWDSRAPFNEFFWEHLALNRTFNVLAMAEASLRGEMRGREYTRAGLRKVFAAKTDTEAMVAWRRYERSYEKAASQGLMRPSAADATTDLRQALYHTREWVISAYVGAFELFVQCWALNYLLARLESPTSGGWTREERMLAIAMSPVHRKALHRPTWPQIVRALPHVRDRLSAIPHVYTDIRTGEVIEVPAHDQLNCYRTMEFWREFRNCSVHDGGIASNRFVERCGEFFELLRLPYAEFVPPLRAGRRLEFWDQLVVAVMTVHYKAAAWMMRYLVEVSTGRRGHLNAPGPVLGDQYYPKRPESPPLLIVGDHAESLSAISREVAE